MHNRQKGAWLLLLFTLNSYAVTANTLNDIITTKEQRAQVKTNTQKYALAFIFSSTCPHCQRFAPTLEAFAATTNLPVYAFSADGKGVHTYTQPLMANQDVLSKFFPNQESIVYPALFLVDVNTRAHIPLSIGNVPFNVLNQTYQAAMTYPHIQARLAQ
ncbi:conjugal transfer protein TraF [Aliivibrio fischeri]|uniref:Type-F conjugative transfer system pilin assembly thiol-disulfide isomerase TrbB n=1 Tax=Aliivibrio fischeri TaxID=668 RepID=A0A510UMV2_ALIFS|nr:conjugal transfer protein TraF [Aliivibrio fischeri]GEK15909.1 type-F conjugative transfer system pilin assembly thiol-disulfide isomerase TrbB [Aliivibrio fischeri]